MRRIDVFRAQLHSLIDAVAVAARERAGGHTERVRALEEAARVQEARYAELSAAKARVDAELQATSAKLSQALERVQLLTTQAARQERFAALGSLAASVAHNVRNPLSALISGLPAMRKRIAQHLDHPTSELMEVMVDCAQRIERLTLDLLDLSRIDRASNGDYAPGSGLLACVRMFAARLDGGNIELDTESVDVLAMATGRAGEINHVFMNVIDNAVRAIAGKGSIAVRGGVDSGFYVVSVGDSGSGIAPENLERVFEPFWTTRVPGEGTGLGLAIARQIVEDHGGTITAGRSPLGGAEFTIRLPLRRAERAA